MRTRNITGQAMIFHTLRFDVKNRFFGLFVVALVSLFFEDLSADEAAGFRVSDQAYTFLDKHCTHCHDEAEAKGGVQLDDLEGMPLKLRLETLNEVQEQLFSYNMPPKKKTQPSEEDRMAMMGWVSRELQRHDASTLESKLELYRYGNLVPHHKLFSGEIKDVPYTEPRYWRLNAYNYNERVRNVFGEHGRELKMERYSESSAALGRDLDGKIIIGLPIVFRQAKESGVAYFDNESVGGSHFMALKDNAEWIVDVQLRSALKAKGIYKYPDGYEKTRPRYRKTRFPQYLFNTGTPLLSRPSSIARSPASSTGGPQLTSSSKGPCSVKQHPPR